MGAETTSAAFIRQDAAERRLFPSRADQSQHRIAERSAPVLTSRLHVASLQMGMCIITCLDVAI